jgi:acetyl esterase/lipase
MRNCSKIFLFLFGSMVMVYAGSDGEQQFYRPVFKDIDVCSDIQYGRNIAVNGDSVNLYLDCYQPAVDNSKNRPLVIFLHSGGFHDGEKEDPKNVKICKAIASWGYVAASVAYRTGIPKKRKRYFTDAILRAIEDTYDAIAFFKSRGDYFGVDTGKIFLGGISAGAVIALHYVFWDVDDSLPTIDGTHEMYYILKKKSVDGISSVKGVINCWGSLLHPSFIENNNVPILSFHGTKDRLAPFKKGHPMFIPWLPKVYGSYGIHQRALRKQHFSVLKTYKGMRHGHDEQSVYMDTTLAVMHNFLSCLSIEQQDYLTILRRLNNAEEGSLIRPELWYSPFLKLPDIVLQEDEKAGKTTTPEYFKKEKTSAF